MMIKEPGLTALRFTYVAVRTPWELLNEQVVARAFGPDSTAHRTLDQGLQTFDALARKAFASCGDSPADHATDETPHNAAEPLTVPKPAKKFTPAEEPEEPEPSEKPTPEPASERADETIDAAEQQEIADLADSYLEDEQLGNRAGELAEDDEVRRVQAEIRAKQNIEDQHGQL
jgi:hypothetical protein